MEKTKLISDLKPKEKAFIAFDTLDDALIFDEQCFSKTEDLETTLTELLKSSSDNNEPILILEITCVRKVKTEKTTKLINA